MNDSLNYCIKNNDYFVLNPPIDSDNYTDYIKYGMNGISSR
jgi:hypothetical protein